IKCQESNRPFKIIPEELKFYRENNIPIPRFHYDIRYKHRLLTKNKRILYDRKCDKCKKDIKTTYSKERLEIVYCEDCYNKEMY
ncbi:MAG: hypothetical protein PHN31_05340, partial [Candidatus Gracilibacteria bacterium]|nr:hypothetical protein [Candidatus Gracilibacteria bacterium]